MVRSTDRPDMTLDVYRGRKTTIQQEQQQQSVKPVPVRLITFLCIVGFENNLAQMIIMTRGCVVNKNHICRSKVKVTVHS